MIAGHKALLRSPRNCPQTSSRWIQAQARLEIFRWLTYYNARRRHSALSYLSPMEFEQHHRRTAKLSLAA
ncbi:integrase core domain-containing protein [Streptomyces sp. NPDC056653]|uniref:integrase core domain-containing protein n=1 Tax=Streptomyces sp. NPDC056653 TaxID=3345894 RepID=UPI0036C0B259